MAKPRKKAATTKRGAARAAFTAHDIVDAPEHFAYARAMGLLTWSTWDTETRPFEDRVKDVLQSFPVDSPTRFQGSMLARTADGDYVPGDGRERVARLFDPQSCFGTRGEILARYGLKLRSGPHYAPRRIEIRPLREMAQRRNQRLRELYGRVDVEAANMDEAKAAELDRLERKRAAEEIRQARARMRDER